MPGPFFKKENFKIEDGKIIRKDDGSQLSEQHFNNRKVNIPPRIAVIDAQIASLQEERTKLVEAMNNIEELIAEATGEVSEVEIP